MAFPALPTCNDAVKVSNVPLCSAFIRPAVHHLYGRCRKDANLLLSPWEKYETCCGAVNNVSLSEDSRYDSGVSGDFRSCRTLPTAGTVKTHKPQSKSGYEITLLSLRTANEFCFLLSNLSAANNCENCYKYTFERHSKVDQNSVLNWRIPSSDHFVGGNNSLTSATVVVWAAACTERMCCAGSGICMALLQTNVVSWAGAGTSGIPPMTALIGRWQKLLGEYGTKWPLLFLEPGAAESPQPCSDVFIGTPALDKSDYLSRRLLLSYFIYFVFNHGLITAPKEGFRVSVKSVFSFCCCWQLIDVESVQEEWRSSLIYWAGRPLPSCSFL